MIWTQIFKNHYFAISDKSKQKWTVALSGTFVDLLSAGKNPEVSSQSDLIFSSYGQNKKMAPDLFFLFT
jgi:hypothetical protein